MPSYHDELKALAESIGSDGCSGPALQVHVECCWCHDLAYATAKTPRGVPITKAQADQQFRDCLQAHSSLRWLSPLSWWRWLAVRQFGHGIWKRPLPVPVRPLYWATWDEALVEARNARAQIMEEHAQHS